MSRHRPSQHLTGLPSLAGPASHVDPTAQERDAADAFLRQRAVEPQIAPALERVVGAFGWAETNYVAAARAEGETSRIWDTTRWIVANALARERAGKFDPEER